MVYCQVVRNVSVTSWRARKINKFGDGVYHALYLTNNTYTFVVGVARYDALTASNINIFNFEFCQCYSLLK